MKKAFIILSTFTLLLFNVFSVKVTAQCGGTVNQAIDNINLTNSTIGQSWVADCNADIQSITVTSNIASTNVTLRVYSQTTLTVIYTLTGITLDAGTPTTIVLTGLPATIQNGTNYVFTLSSSSGLNLLANNSNPFANGAAIVSAITIEINIADIILNLVTALPTTDLVFNITATAAVLPVELTAFKASKLGNQSQLDWTTATESNNQHFAIERSKDGKTFKEIGIVNSKGASYEKQEYTFIDPSPAKGYNYYRLKQVDFNGKYDYSKVEMVALKGYAEVMIYPNPAKESITIETSATDKHEVKIMDYMGRIWLSKTLENNINQLNIASLPKGIYFLESYVDDELVRKKIVKE